MRDRINAAYIPTHPQIAQPVMRVPLTIYRVQDTLMIDEMILHEQPGGAPAANAPAGAAAVGVPIVNQQQHAQTLINLQALQQAVAQNHQQQQESIASLRQWTLAQFRTVNNNIRHLVALLNLQWPGRIHNKRQGVDRQQIHSVKYKKARFPLRSHHNQEP